MKTKYNLDKGALHELSAYQKWAELKELLDDAAAAILRDEVVVPTEYPNNAEPQESPPLRTIEEFNRFRLGWEKPSTSDEEKLND